MLPRLWGNDNKNLQQRGSLKNNSTGKFSGIDGPTLDYIKWLGCTHVWYTGIIRHATKSGSEGCTASHPQFVKGEAGSPYAISDYYDVNPYLADDPSMRMSEFEALVERTHKAGLKVIIDFVPNHVSRDYVRISSQSNLPGPTSSNYEDNNSILLGAGDNKNIHWSPENDFFYYPGQKLTLPNEDEFAAECNSLKNKDFEREYRILSQEIVETAKIKAASSDEEFAGFLEENSCYLTPYQEYPAIATGNVYTPAPGRNDWYETIKINYCDTHTRTWDKMKAILEFWAGKGVDGFRCDMVELVPPEFFKWVIAELKDDYPDLVFIAEVYKKDLYRKYIREVGFDYLYDKSGLYDTLRTIVEKNSGDNGMPLELWQSAKGITRNWQYLGDLQPYMLNFLENHDEQRFASKWFGKMASAMYAPLYVSLLLNRAPFMIYAAQEMGEAGADEEGFSGPDGRTTIFDWWSLESIRDLRELIHSGLYREGESAEWPEHLKKYKEVFLRFSSIVRFASSNPAISKGMTYDLCYCNTNSEGFDIDRNFAFLRDYHDETLLIAVNFSGKTAKMKIRIPAHAFEWLELSMTENLNADSRIEVTVPPMDAVTVTLSSSGKMPDSIS